MAAPAVIGAASMGASAVGGIISGIGQADSANAQAAANQYKAGVAGLNKQINLQNAAWASEAGEAQALTSGMKSRQQIAETKVVQSASGLDVNSGTASRVREDQSQVADYDQNVIRWDAAKTTYGYETKAVMDTAEANLDQMAATSEQQAGQLEMIGSFLNAGGQVASKWMSGKSTGMF